MKKIALLAIALGLGACTGGAETVVPDKAPPMEPVAPVGPVKPDYPASRTEAVADTLHGTEVADPYRWLEKVETDEVQGWMKAQDDFTRGHINALPGRDALTKRLEELYYVESLSAPVKRGKRFFLRRRHPDREKAIIYWKQGKDGEEKVLLDPNTMGKEGENVSLGGWYPSWDGKKVAYKLKQNNADEATMYVMEVASGKVSDIDVIAGAKYAGAAWTPKSDGFYYTWLPIDPEIPAADRPGHAAIKFHKLGTDPAKDPVLHEKTDDPKTFLSPSISRNGRYLFVYKWFGWASVEIYYRDLKNRKHKDWQVFWKPENAQAFVTHWKGYFYVMTNKDSPNQSIWRTKDSKPARDQWELIVPEPDFVIDDFEIIGDHLVLSKLQNATSGLQVRKLDGTLVRDVKLPDVGAVFGVQGLPEEPGFYYGYTSYTTPWQIYETSVTSEDSTLWTEVKIPVDPSPYKVEQVWYESKDGTKVSMFIVRRKDAPNDGSTPFLLYGYGGFQVSLKPYFRSSIYPWLEAGGGYAVANLRGGGEYGEEWHKNGMLLKKQNTFDDFIGAAEFLIEKGYTKTEHLAIRGGSNGGLLVGAAMTQRPDLFGAVVCAVPLLDMVRYHLHGSGKTWIGEYGSADDAEQFKVLHAYSPYHAIKPNTAYPATLLLSATNDDRVDPFHARKFAASVQAATSDDAPILLRIEQQAGHGGADLVKQRVEQSADVYAFLMSQFGMTPAAK
jgi:prolyl oligopeptidase